MTEDEFEAQFTTIDGDEGSYHTKVPKGTPDNRVWTAVDGDDGNIYLLPGYHYVNRINYVITEEPWTDGGITVAWLIFPDEDDGATTERWEVTDPFQHAEPDMRGKHDPTL